MILSLSNCATAPPLDDYCSLYDPVVTGKGDGAITATPNVKRRILGNELKFRNLCPGG